ncbi:hypothetical protein JHK82_013498 [Glycine max]|uniref:Uncharacterized protein n=1 Tax=Glycine soja TaxID=3848 RepID=A0A0B2Q770_GLYSO|nr:hypothetical protein JHK85_013867 [Glycine max]KAG5155529.1 hypothetical protein JHK82_013498 [Glycine max]KHN17471.1 hypothetical protein glysoja_027014 [Glycine soja]
MYDLDRNGTTDLAKDMVLFGRHFVLCSSSINFTALYSSCSKASSIWGTGNQTKPRISLKMMIL